VHGLTLLYGYLTTLGVTCPQGDLDTVCDTACDVLSEGLSKAGRMHLGLGRIAESGA